VRQLVTDHRTSDPLSAHYLDFADDHVRMVGTRASAAVC
jgi:hypothetical protein